MFALAFITLIVIAFTYILSKSRFTYWQKRNIKTLNNQHVIFGDIAQTIYGKEHFVMTVDKAYKEFKSKGCPFGGIYSLGNPMLLAVDPEFIKCVLSKDFDHFVGRGIEYDEETNPLSAHLFNLSGDEWRLIRKKVTSTFTPAKLKTMYWIIEENLDSLCKEIEKKAGEDIHVIEMIERSGMDIIGQSAFGLKCNALENKSSPFRNVTTKLFQPNILRVLYLALKYCFRNHANLALFATDDQKCNEFFINLIKDTVQYRNENNIKINDFLQLLMELMEPKDGEAGLDINKVAANCFIFFIAGYETTSRTLNLLMYELGKNKKLQEELRREVVEVLSNNDWKYTNEVVSKCNLLDMVIKENLRKHTPGSILNRYCNQDYKVPGTNIVIEAGTPIILSLYSLHMDPEYFPKPQEFDPYRFTKENEATIKPFTYMPFGEGPRYCIGNRLGQYHLKTAVIKLITNFEISVSPKTEEPLVMKSVTDSLLLTYKQELYFQFKKI